MKSTQLRYGLSILHVRGVNQCAHGREPGIKGSGAFFYLPSPREEAFCLNLAIILSRHFIFDKNIKSCERI